MTMRQLNAQMVNGMEDDLVMLHGQGQWNVRGYIFF